MAEEFSDSDLPVFAGMKPAMTKRPVWIQFYSEAALIEYC